jgi:putative transcriptional regulator
MSKILKAMHKSAKGLYDAGVMDAVTMRQMDDLCLSSIGKMTPKQIKQLRLDNRVSQPVFAKYLNVSPVTVKKWESGEKHPSGAALKLLSIVKNNSLQALSS